MGWYTDTRLDSCPCCGDPFFARLPRRYDHVITLARYYRHTYGGHVYLHVIDTEQAATVY